MSRSIIIALHEHGWSPENIASALTGVQKSKRNFTAEKIASVIAGTDDQSQPRKFTDEFKRSIALRWCNGESKTALAREAETSLGHITIWIEKHLSREEQGDAYRRFRERYMAEG